MIQKAVLILLLLGANLWAEVTIKGANIPATTLQNMKKVMETVISQSSKENPQWNLPATADGLEALKEFWGQTRFIPLEMSYISYALKVKGKSQTEYELRGFSVKTKDSEEADELVFRFNDKGQLIASQTSMQFQKVNALLKGAGDDLTDLRRRQLILDFLANYRTAYVKKDLNYIDKVMNDKALIIKGRILEEKTVEQKLEKKVELVRQNKTEYLNDLKRVFAANASIRVEFDSIQIMKHQNENYTNWYGVKLVQTWTSVNKYSSKNYSDEGNLFLLVNFQNEDYPEIWVRSWQPKESIQKESDAISISDFPFE